MPPKSNVVAPIAYKTNIKRAVVNALRAVFDSDYPDQFGQLDNINVTNQWPDKPEQYPSIIVNFQETPGSLKSMGIGHFEHVLGGPNTYRRWQFEGDVQLIVAAETSLARDYFSDHIVHLLAFGQTSIFTNVFLPALMENRGLDIQIMHDTLVAGGDNVENGADWGLDDFRIYTAAYSFHVFGTFTSGIVQNAYVRGVNEATEII